MSVTKAKTDNITSLNAAQLTGVLPAMSGAALTGLTQPTKSANDPTISTNPSTGVGTLWANTTSGEMYACTDATAGENVWINVGSGEGDIAPYIAGCWGGQGGGTAFGYHAGGLYPQTTSVQGKYSYASDGNSTGVASLTTSGYAGSGCQSTTVGYGFGHDGAPATAQGQKVEKHIFASNNQSRIGGGTDLALWHLQLCGATNSTTHAYTIGGGYNSAPGSSHPNYGGVQKMSFSTEATMTFVGTAYNHNGSSTTLVAGSSSASLTHGYRAGGHGGPQTSSIEKFAFATDSNSAFVGTMVRGIDTGCSGGSSPNHGYIMGGHGPGRNEIGKFSFQSDGNSTDVGDLHTGQSYGSGTSSTTHSYMAGGGHPQINNIQKVSHTTDGNATDVGDMVQARAYVLGYQD